MSIYKEKVKKICDEIYIANINQTLIDFIQDEVEVIVDSDEYPSRQSVGALAYTCGCLIDVYNPKFSKDIDILTRLQNALSEWSDDIENTNIILGLPKET